jgi:hypothetical protein
VGILVLWLACVGSTPVDPITPAPPPVPKGEFVSTLWLKERNTVADLPRRMSSLTVEQSFLSCLLTFELDLLWDSLGVCVCVFFFSPPFNLHSPSKEDKKI